MNTTAENAEIVVGGRYRHRAKPEWGVGQLLSCVRSRAVLFFESGGRRAIVDAARFLDEATGETGSASPSTRSAD